MPYDPTPEWAGCYGVVGTFATHNIAASVSLLDKEGQAQLADGDEKAPAWAVLGAPTGGDGSQDKARVWWVAYFESSASYHTDHKEAQKKEARQAFLPKMREMLLTGNMMQDMAGGHMGSFLHLENPAAKGQASFALLNIVTGTSMEAAACIVDIQKRASTVSVQASRGKCLRVTIAGPPGDHPGGDSTPAVYILEQWTSEPDYESFIVMPGRVPTPSPGIAPYVSNMKTAVKVLTFAKNMKHYSR